MCAAFFWHGRSDSTKGASVKWEIVCKPKNEGGLGLKQVQ